MLNIHDFFMETIRILLSMQNMWNVITFQVQDELHFYKKEFKESMHMSTIYVWLYVSHQVCTWSSKGLNGWKYVNFNGKNRLQVQKIKLLIEWYRMTKIRNIYLFKPKWPELNTGKAHFLRRMPSKGFFDVRSLWRS